MARLRGWWLVWSVVAALGLVLPANAIAAQGTAAEDGLVPESACAGANEWLEAAIERRRVLLAKIDEIKHAYGDDAGRVVPLFDTYLADLRASDPPPALVGVMIVEAMAAENTRQNWLAADPSELRYERSMRMGDYVERTLTAFTGICASELTLEQWYGHGIAAAPTPAAVSPLTGRARRADVCSDAWIASAQDRINTISASLAGQETEVSPERSEAFWQSVYADERWSDPPPAWVATSVVILSYIERIQDDVRHPELQPSITEEWIADWLSMLRQTLTAYEAICKTA